MSSSSIDAAIFYAGIAAALLATFLILSQSDKISRHILSSGRLRAKRRQQELYRIENAIAKSILHIRKYINDGGFYDWKEEQKITDLILRDEDIQRLAREIAIVDSSNAKHEDFQSSPLIVGIAKDLTLSKADEWYIYLAFPVKMQNEHCFDIEKRYYGRRVQIPLEKFSLYLSSEYEKQKYPCSLCFIADASGSLGSNFIGQIIENCQCEIPVIQEPTWMYTIAFLVQKRLLHKDSIEKIMYSLCKLSAQAQGHKVGRRYNTVAVTLPGQACTASLLPFLKRIFPDDKHVFAYDGCFESVERAFDSVETIPETSMPRQISSTIPISPMYFEKFTSQTASLPHNIACITEAWLSSIDALHRLKNEKDSIEFNPFICHMTSLVSQNNEKLLNNLLKYVTGDSKSDMKMEVNVIDAAQSLLEDLMFKNKNPLKMRISQKSRIVIENCISLYKLTIVGDELISLL